MVSGSRWVAEKFDRRAATYDRSESHQWQARQAVDLLDPRPGERILDVAAGTGLAGRDAARRAYPHGQVVGTDLSLDMLRAAVDAVPGDAVPCAWVQADAAHGPFPSDCFDAVLCVAAVPYFPDLVAALRDWRRLARATARLVITTPAVDGLTTARVLRRAARSEGVALDDPGGPLADARQRPAVLRNSGWQLDALDDVVFEQPLEDPETAFGFVDSGFAEPLRTADTATRDRVQVRFDALYRAEDTEVHRLLRLRLTPA